MYYLCTTKTTNTINSPNTINLFIMNKQEILDVVKSLAMSQGYYGRLYDVLTNGTDEAEYALQEMEEQNFKDAVDMIMWLEC